MLSLSKQFILNYIIICKLNIVTHLFNKTEVLMDSVLNFSYALPKQYTYKGKILFCKNTLQYKSTGTDY